jgi:hypothetical protein
MLTPRDLIKLRGNCSAADRYIDARRQSSNARIGRKERMERAHHDGALLRWMLDADVADAEATEARALAELEADPRDRWELGGGVALVRVA